MKTRQKTIERKDIKSRPELLQQQEHVKEINRYFIYRYKSLLPGETLLQLLLQGRKTTPW